MVLQFSSVKKLSRHSIAWLTQACRVLLTAGAIAHAIIEFIKLHSTQGNSSTEHRAVFIDVYQVCSKTVKSSLEASLAYSIYPDLIAFLSNRHLLHWFVDQNQIEQLTR